MTVDGDPGDECRADEPAPDRDAAKADQKGINSAEIARVTAEREEREELNRLHLRCAADPEARRQALEALQDILREPEAPDTSWINRSL